MTKHPYISSGALIIGCGASTDLHDRRSVARRVARDQVREYVVNVGAIAWALPRGRSAMHGREVALGHDLVDAGQHRHPGPSKLEACPSHDALRRKWRATRATSSVGFVRSVRRVAVCLGAA